MDRDQSIARLWVALSNIDLVLDQSAANIPMTIHLAAAALNAAVTNWHREAETATAS